MQIESKDNKLIKLVKSLNQKKYREKEGLFYIEGYKFVKEAVLSSWSVNAVLVSDSFLSGSFGDEWAEVSKRGLNIYNLPDRLFKELTDTENPQGIMAVVEQRNQTQNNLKELFKAPNLFVLLDGIRDPGNMGTIIRTADSAAFTGVILTNDCVDIYNPKVVRAAAGSILHIPCIQTDDIEEAFSILKSNGIKIYSAVMFGTDSCYELHLSENIALVIGNEANGVSPAVVEMSDGSVYIPMLGSAESLNASVAAGILIYEAARQRIIENTIL